MYWVKLTKIDGDPVWVNLERYDRIVVGATENNSHQEVTLLLATLSETEEDYTCIEVLEKPETIFTMPWANRGE